MSWIDHILKSQKYIYSVPILTGIVCSASLSGLDFSIFEDLISEGVEVNNKGFFVISTLIFLWCSSFLWMHVNKFYITKRRAIFPFVVSLFTLSFAYIFIYFLFSLFSLNFSRLFLDRSGLSGFLAKILIDGLSSMGAFLTIPVLWKNPSDNVQSLRRARAQLVGLLSKIKEGEELPQNGEQEIIGDLKTIAEADEELRYFLASDRDKCLLQKWKDAAEDHLRVLDREGPEGEVIKYFSKSERSEKLSSILKT